MPPLSQTVPPSHVDEFQFIYGRHHSPARPGLEPLRNCWVTKMSSSGRKGAVFASFEEDLRAESRHTPLLDRRGFGGLASVLDGVGLLL